MTETTQPAGTSGTAPAGGSGTQPATGQAPSGQSQTETTNRITDERGRPIETLERALELLSETRTEAADNRRRLRALEQQQQTAAQAGQTEAQRLQQALEATTAERDRLLRAARAGVVADHARQAATDLHAINPAVIAKMVQFGEVEWDETDPNKPKNITRLVQRLRDEFPDYFRAGSADGGTPGKPAKQDMNALIRGAAGRR